MSTPSITKPEYSGIRVIVRAYAGEPVSLRAQGRIGGAIRVVGDQGRSIGFPADDVFDYDETLCGRLKAAFEGDDRSALSALWAEAHRFEPG